MSESQLPTRFHSDMFRILRRLLYGGTCALRDYERACLDALRENLDPEGQAILAAQVAASNLVQRWSRDKLVVLYALGSDPLPLFTNGEPERTIARIDVRPLVRNRALGCTVVLHEGRLSSLEFSAPPRDALMSGCRVERVRLFADPMRPPEPVRQSALGAASAPEPLLDARIPASDVLPPALPAFIAAFLDQLAAAPPEDYVTLLSETDGFLANGWQFMGTRARRVVWPDGTYILVAECEPLALCFREGDEERRIFLMDQGQGEVTLADSPFMEALSQVAGSGQPHPDIGV